MKQGGSGESVHDMKDPVWVGESGRLSASIVLALAARSILGQFFYNHLYIATITITPEMALIGIKH